MTHVFVAASHSSYLSSIGIIKLLGLLPSDVIFLFARHYKCKYHLETYKTYDVSDDYIIYFRNNTRNGIQEKISQIDDFIDKTIAGDYTLYIANLSFPYHQIWATNAKCCDIKLIQEGIIDFCSKVKVTSAMYCWLVNALMIKSARVWKSYKWNTTKRLRSGVSISETFAITDKLYNDIDVKHSIIEWPKFELDKSISRDSPVFVFESAVEMRLIPCNIYMDAVKKIVGHYAGARNYVKFHPFQSEDNKKMILGIFRETNLVVEKLPDDVPFEIILSSQKGLRVYGFSTSLVFFATILGHNAISFVPMLLQSSKFKKYWREFYCHLKRYGDNYFKFQSN